MTAMNNLANRSRLYREIRNFFDEQNYLEVETPLLSPDLIPESNIEVFKAPFIHPYKEKKDLFLIPSPEIWMKKLLAAGSGSIYQICKSFRNAESLGQNHNPEFTMLEYYSINKDYMDSISITEDLFDSLSFKLPNDLKPPFRSMTMEEVCKDLAGLDLGKAESTEAMLEEAVKRGHSPDSSEPWETLFNRIFLTEVEPRLPDDRPLVLLNYPSQISCLAAECSDGPFKQRWELYARGIELANCYTEETDPEKVHTYYKDELLEKEKHGLIQHPVDNNFSSIFSTFPPCSGVAMGVDRLLMLLTNSNDIRQVLPFPLREML